ncbi:MAG: cache and HAMP domain-containing protein [Cyanobacteria bacterium J06642_11]
MLDALNPFQKSLLAQIMATFSLLSLVTVSLVSYTAYHQARESIERTVYNQLKSAILLKEYQLIEWFENHRREASVLARSPLIIDAIEALNNESARQSDETSANIPGSDTTDGIGIGSDATTTLKKYLKLITEIEDNLYTIELLTPTGKIILSNQGDRQGQFLPPEKTTYFESERTNQTTAPSFVVPKIYLNDAQALTVTLATPVVDETGRSLDVVLATTPKSETVNRIMRQRAGLGQSGEAYLVKTIEDRPLFLTGTSTGVTVTEATNITSQGIEKSTQGEDGEGLYLNYKNIPVVGVYHWNEQYEIAILAELSQEEAFLPAVHLARRILVIGIFATVLLLVLVYVFARQIVYPILLINRAAIALESNRFRSSMLKSISNRPDELGQLVHTFSRMADHTSAQRDRLKAKIQQGNERISQLFGETISSNTNSSANTTPSNTKINVGKQQASELELAYYDALKRKATWLRQQATTIDTPE